MKVGDLVRIMDGGSGLVHDGDIPPDAIGIVVAEPSTACFQKGGATRTLTHHSLLYNIREFSRHWTPVANVSLAITEMLLWGQST